MEHIMDEKPIQKENEHNDRYLERVLNWETKMREQADNEMGQNHDVLSINVSKIKKQLDDQTEKLQAFITLLNENNRLMRQQNEKKTDTTTS